MKKEIIVNSSPNEVRVALLEDGEVVEFSMERAESRRAVGNVYKGVVTAVRPGLQAAFVEIGMDKAGFLHVSDLIHDEPEDDDDGAHGGRRRRRGRREGLRPIETMLKEGDELLVQVTKEIIGTKGPRLTADISLPGRFMVLMPKGDHVGVSRKIEDRKERHRLRDLLSAMKPDDEGGAFIIRTAAIGIEPKMLQRDMEYLRDLWKTIQTNAHGTQAPAVVHQDVGLLFGMIRDIFKDDIDGLILDSREEYNELMQHVRNFSPELRERIHFYEGDVPIFDKYGVEQELKKSLERKVWMKRGGFLVIDEAEALVAIDVNTGRYTGRKNQAETIFKTNMLAAKEIARQLRLRDMGGIIVCDFIDMESEEDKRKVLNELRLHLKRDRARTKTFPVTDLGLVEMSRQRVQQSLKDRLSDDCPYCGGGGQVLSTDTLANRVERLLLKLAATRDEKAVQVRANPTLALVLMTDRANDIQNIARSTGIRIDVVDDPRLHREQFQVVSVHRRKDLVAEIEKIAGERQGDGPPSRQEEARRGRDRDEDSAGDRERGGRGRNRRRGRDEEDAQPRSQERRPSRRGSEGEESSERPSRRRRSEGDERPRRQPADERPRGERDADERPRRERDAGERPRRDRDAGERPRRDREAREFDEPVEEVVVSTAAVAGGHPAEEDDDEPRRRRRRRGRRGGRGRRRGREDEETGVGEEATGRAAEGRRRPEPVPAARGDFDEEEGDETIVAAVSGEDDVDDDGGRNRRRRRGSRGRGRGEGRDEIRPVESEEGAPVMSREESRAAANGEMDQDAGRRPRRPRPPRREETAGSTGEWVKPVPEDEWMARRGAIEAASVTQESLSAPEPEEETVSVPDHGAEDSVRADRPRRRRPRRSGTPTRLIGTGKKGPDAN